MRLSDLAGDICWILGKKKLLFSYLRVKNQSFFVRGYAEDVPS